MPGAPDVAAVILDKIKGCDIFIADVSMINSDSLGGSRKTPNPNVMFELGYAVAIRTWERILCIMNTADGNAESLPFDIRHHRVILYEIGPDRTHELAVQGRLVAELKSAIGSILSGNLALMAFELKQLFDEIDPTFMNNVRRGRRSAEVDVPLLHSQRLGPLMLDKEFAKLATFVQEGNIIWKPSLGPTNVYKVTVTERFVELAG